MTVAIAVVVPGGVLTIADGRTSMVFSNEVKSDTTQKIKTALLGMTTVVTGVESVTDNTLILIRSADPPQSAQGAVDLSRGALLTAWNHFSQNLDSSVDRSTSALKTALIVTGIDQGRPYYSASLIGFDVALDTVGPNFDVYDHVVIGGEQQGAQEGFRKKLEAIASLVNPGDNVIAITERIVRAAAETILEVAAVDAAVGGEIVYRLQPVVGDIIDAPVLS